MKRKINLCPTDLEQKVPVGVAVLPDVKTGNAWNWHPREILVVFHNTCGWVLGMFEFERSSQPTVQPGHVCSPLSVRAFGSRRIGSKLLRSSVLRVTEKVLSS